MKNAKLLRRFVLAVVLVMLAVLPVIAMASSAPTVTTTDKYMLVGGESFHLWLYNDKLARQNNWFPSEMTGAELNAAYTFDFETENGIEVVESRTQFTESGAKPQAYIRVNGAEAEGKKVTCTMTMNATGEQYVQEYVVHVVGVRKAPTVVAEPSTGFKVVEGGDFVLTIEEGTPVTVSLNYETLSGEKIPVDYCDWSLYNGSGYTIQGVAAASYTYTNIQDGDSIEWYAEGGSFSDCGWITVTVVPKGTIDAPVNKNYAYKSPAFVNAARGIGPFLNGDVQQIFVVDYNDDGKITVDELNANVTMTVTADSSIEVVVDYPDFENSEYEAGAIEYPTFKYKPLSKNADGKKVVATITNTRGDKVVYELTVALKDVVRKEPTITGDILKNNGVDEWGYYQLQVEAGADVTITANYETLSGGKADVDCDWYFYALDGENVTEGVQNGNTYTIRNIQYSGGYYWDVLYESGDDMVSDFGGVDIVVVPKQPVVEEELTKTEYEEGISEVPAALQSNPELNSPAKIEAAISIELTAAAEEMGMDVQPEDKQVYDVSLQYSPDGGDTWVKADETHWPDDGKIKVVLPYPEGTGQFTHTFAVAHMFTKAMNGNVPGTYEYPEVTNTAAGIEFYVTGLSPVALVWEEKPAPVVPATGDNASLALWISLMMLGAAGCVFAGRKMRRS